MPQRRIRLEYLRSNVDPELTKLGFKFLNCDQDCRQITVEYTINDTMSSDFGSKHIITIDFPESYPCHPATFTFAPVPKSRYFTDTGKLLTNLLGIELSFVTSINHILMHVPEILTGNCSEEDMLLEVAKLMSLREPQTNVITKRERVPAVAIMGTSTHLDEIQTLPQPEQQNHQQ